MISFKTKNNNGSGDCHSTPYILALDVGTTSIRSHVYDKDASIIGVASRKVELIYPQPGWVEMDPELLWQQTQDVIKESMIDAGVSAQQVTCLGITTQRNTFITWDRETGRPFHRFITWQDLRASHYVEEWNNSYSMKLLAKISKCIYYVTRNNRYLAASVLTYKSAQVTMRLKWMIDNNAEMRQRLDAGQVMFGNIDTWLLWKLTDKKTYATDYSCASVTGLFDPFTMQWSGLMCGIFKIPLHIFPQVMDTSCLFGYVEEKIFGASIPIMAIAADQQSSLFGQCCFTVGDVKCTMGTGTFIDCNTGSKPHASCSGLYPLIGWKIGTECVFVAEGYASDSGRCLEWGRTIDLYDTVESTSEIAASVNDSGGVYFVSAFSGLQMPINDDRASTLMIGITLDTQKKHIVKALVDSLAYRFLLLYETMQRETKTPLSSIIKCDGGVCRNSYLVQLISDLTDRKIDRPRQMDMTSLGVAFLAGLAAGVWKNKEELIEIRKTQHFFSPDDKGTISSRLQFKRWELAMERSKKWNEHPGNV